MYAIMLRSSAHFNYNSTDQSVLRLVRSVYTTSIYGHPKSILMPSSSLLSFLFQIVYPFRVVRGPQKNQLTLMIIWKRMIY